MNLSLKAFIAIETSRYCVTYVESCSAMITISQSAFTVQVPDCVSDSILIDILYFMIMMMIMIVVAADIKCMLTE